MSQELVTLEVNGWNGVWARIITNFLTTARLEEFDVIVGNPPWIDWKNLPEGYREKIKSLCIDRGLFSGAGRTGGINLNICALITHVSITNWLKAEGTLAFLMPAELATQASYEGWRRLGRDNLGQHRLAEQSSRDFLEFFDWKKAGHPFDPVKEDFMTYVIGPNDVQQDYSSVVRFEKRRGDRSRARKWSGLQDALGHLEQKDAVAGQIIPHSTAYTFADSYDELQNFKIVAGECAYIGREGIEFYPQELQLFRYDSPGPRSDTAFLRNIQVQRSRYQIPEQRQLLETKYLFPLVKGPAIRPFRHEYEGLIVAFPYDQNRPHQPLNTEELDAQSRLLLGYYRRYQDIIRAQTGFSDRIRGANAGEFYGLARTGPYSFANVYVAFRDNTRWCATVVDRAEMPWGEAKRFVFQNHAVSICERGSGEFITPDEAHYICAIFNASIVEKFIRASSDKRSFKIRPPVYVPLFDLSDKRHLQLSELSKSAHSTPNDMQSILSEIEEIYLSICRDRA